MKAAVLTAPERIDTVGDWVEPVCGPGDVIVETHGVGPCGTDLAGAAVRAGKTWIGLGSEYA
ncbi:hypothetical protein [Streptomyces canus]|uniref:hypothetical protein n=1 Tax=Streptomyces canus TaxID=58343 RepID=UPI00371DCDF4